MAQFVLPHAEKKKESLSAMCHLVILMPVDKLGLFNKCIAYLKGFGMQKFICYKYMYIPVSIHCNYYCCFLFLSSGKGPTLRLVHNFRCHSQVHVQHVSPSSKTLSPPVEMKMRYVVLAINRLD